MAAACRHRKASFFRAMISLTSTGTQAKRKAAWISNTTSTILADWNKSSPNRIGSPKPFNKKPDLRPPVGPRISFIALKEDLNLTVFTRAGRAFPARSTRFIAIPMTRFGSNFQKNTIVLPLISWVAIPRQSKPNGCDPAMCIFRENWREAGSLRPIISNF